MRPVTRSWLLAFVLVGACRCSREPAPPPPTPRAAAAPASPTPAAPDAPDAPTAPEDPPPPPPIQPPAQVAETERMNRAADHAADEAERAPRGADDCETAHNQLIVMLDTVEREVGQPIHHPAREAFLEVCREMPREAQRCIVPTVAMEEQETCGRMLDELPDDLQQRFQIVVAGSN